MDWSGFFSGLKLDTRQLFAGLFLAGCTILLANHKGWLPPLDTPLGAVWMATILGGWMSALSVAPHFWSKYSDHRAIARQKTVAAAQEQRRRDAILARLQNLSPDQRLCLAAIKDRNNREFQAYRDDQLRELQNMNLVLVRAQINNAIALFEIPEFIWDVFEVTADDRANLERRQPVWVNYMRQHGRI